MVHRMNVFKPGKWEVGHLDWLCTRGIVLFWRRGFRAPRSIQGRCYDGKIGDTWFFNTSIIGMTGNPVRFGRGWFRSAIAPWEAFAIGFTLLFKSFQRELVPIMPVHHVCMTFGVIDHKRWSLIKKYTNLCREAADNSAVDTIDLEETAARLWHDPYIFWLDLDAIFVLLISGTSTPIFPHILWNRHFTQMPCLLQWSPISRSIRFKMPWSSPSATSIFGHDPIRPYFCIVKQKIHIHHHHPLPSR